MIVAIIILLIFFILFLLFACGIKVKVSGNMQFNYLVLDMFLFRVIHIKKMRAYIFKGKIYYQSKKKAYKELKLNFDKTKENSNLTNKQKSNEEVKNKKKKTKIKENLAYIEKSSKPHLPGIKIDNLILNVNLGLKDDSVITVLSVLIANLGVYATEFLIKKFILVNKKHFIVYPNYEDDTLKFNTNFILRFNIFEISLYLINLLVFNLKNMVKNKKADNI